MSVLSKAPPIMLGYGRVKIQFCDCMWLSHLSLSHPWESQQALC